MSVFAAGINPHVSLPAEEVFNLFGFPITNSIITGVLGYGLIIWMFIYVARRVKKNNKNLFVSLVQWVYEMLYTTVEQVAGNKDLARRIAPLSITMFFFIALQYWLGILPVVGPLTWDGIPIFRSLVADLNLTFGLAILTMLMAQVYAFKFLGFRGNIGRYLRNPLKDPAGAFEGILELIAEFSRLLGLSFRLFGNVFAGEVLLMMIALLTVYASPLALPPFYIFELFIGGVQAYIFFMLTTVFISLGVAHGNHDESHAEIDHSSADSAKLAVANDDK